MGRQHHHRGRKTNIIAISGRVQDILRGPMPAGLRAWPRFSLALEPTAYPQGKA